MEKMQCALFAIERDAIDLFELKQQRDRDCAAGLAISRESSQRNGSQS